MTAPWNARLYDEKHSFVWKRGASLVELLDPQAGEKVLDLGCGTGHLTAQLAAAGADVTGVDSSPQMIAEAGRNHPELRFEIGDARHLPYVEQFDGILSNAVLHWIREADLVARSVRRALKPGGRFVAELGGRGNVQAIVAAVQAALQTMGCPTAIFPWFFPSVAEYSTVLEEAGLEVTLATLFDRPTPLEGAAGMREWIRMFGGHFLGQVPQERHEEFFVHVEGDLRGRLFAGGSWFADYRRLRVVARRNDLPGKPPENRAESGGFARELGN